MKLSKSTTIFLNIMLILVIALLIKSVISVPKNLYAKGMYKYKVTIDGDSRSEIEENINKMAKEGWRLHSTYHVALGYLLFERNTQ